ncbi:hypothetical protein D8674_013313 [Pyrus ussuriensis x Pyrus communis]|uniref:Uncharacterized protein n=1 Tax=Pyrus ussuriensis x Pyrus communis TaxID=2448454 RepID=A0A5N5H2X0_9ROSA|nr:hypothetical protein D8674_013313 [Pyrus ussuriensis x Pyrus communis]
MTIETVSGEVENKGLWSGFEDRCVKAFSLRGCEKLSPLGMGSFLKGVGSSLPSRVWKTLSFQWCGKLSPLGVGSSLSSRVWEAHNLGCLKVDDGFSSFGSWFKPTSSSLESYEDEVLGDPHDHQTCLPFDEEAGEEHRYRDRALDIGASTSHVSLVEEGILNVIPIFRSEFTVDHLDKNLLDSRRQLDALRESCCIPNNIGMGLVRDEELPTDPPKGHVMFYTQILEKLGIKLSLHPWLQKMLTIMGYAPGQLNPSLWETLIGTYIIWIECGLGEPSFLQWQYCYKMRLAKSSTGYVECACRSEKEHIVFVSKKAIKLSGQELADVQKVLSNQKRIDTWTSYDPCFKSMISSPCCPSARDEFVNNCLAGHRATIDEFGEPLIENESDRDWMMRLFAYCSMDGQGSTIGTSEFVGTRATDANNFKCSTGITASVPKASENGVSLVEIRYEGKTSLVELIIDDQVPGRLVSNLLSLDFIILEGTFVRVQPHLVPPQDGEGFRQVGDVLANMLALD